MGKEGMHQRRDDGKGRANREWKGVMGRMNGGWKEGKTVRKEKYPIMKLYYLIKKRFTSLYKIVRVCVGGTVG